VTSAAGVQQASRLALPFTAIALLLLGLASASGAETAPENIPLGSEPSSCASETSAGCERWAVERLDDARAESGLAAYVLPADFTVLTPDRQLLILTDLDRLAHGYTPVYGLNSDLSEAALAGVREAADPTPPASGGPWTGFGSDWASTNALIGYFLWMYDDGYGSPNGDCTSPGAAGCWGHRRVILGEAVSLPQPQLMGAGAGSAARSSGSALIISSNGGTASYYTWAQAQLEGAGAGEERPPVTAPSEGPPAEAPKTPAAPPAGGPNASAQGAGHAPGGAGTPPHPTVLAASLAPAARLAELLGDHLLPSRRPARIPVVLRKGRLTFMLPAGLRGRLVVECFTGARRHLLVAKGTRLLTGSRAAVVARLTAAGRHLLRHRGRVALGVDARLVSPGGTAVDLSRPLILTR